MAASNSDDEILYNFSPIIKVFKNGRFEKLVPNTFAPASLDPDTGVQSKDVEISPENGVSARLYLPSTAAPGQKLPLLVYIHGGGFMVESAFAPHYHKHLNSLVSKANIVAVSVNYRLAPEHPLPICYEDSWLALKWVGSGHEEWIEKHADLGRVYLGGDSAGGNIAHNIAMRVGSENINGVVLRGIFLDCPFFLVEDPMGNEANGFEPQFWRYVCPSTTGCDDPRANPAMDPKLSSIGCKRVLVYVAENDILKDRGWDYKEALKKSGWDGDIEVVDITKTQLQISFTMSSKNILSILLLFNYSFCISISTNTSDILYDIYPFIRVYTNGTILRFIGTGFVPACIDPTTGVQSKDIVITPEINLTARIYLPKNVNPGYKIPLLVYFHGGGFFTESAFSPSYHNHMNAVVAKANIVAVSINYRLAPEHLLPICYEDSWLALKWVFSHFKGNGNEPWLNNYVDFGHVHLGGDSAGANIAHNMGIRAGLDKTHGVIIDGIFLNCPHFWGKRLIGNEASNILVKNLMENIWVHAYPNSTGLDDPLLNPAMDPNLWRLGCKRVLVYLAGNDILRDRGWYYKETLRKSKWRGFVKVIEVIGEDHDFGVRFPDTPNAIQMMKRFASFLDQRKV
ncbi:hypothetical protein BUALT_Bualt15G0035600 [Buddleja alternifolia]|uniref:Alpha/beta hydrolase fold-3 domain-containing protein n=1 Tax=Buddleja alternifolia TaxID=168488 RepID=A0AAV6WLF2_9LAMI|nr:hypothetical protein BUALT_Bualt15G0035600 [Buddleja alternifolia]